MKCFTMSYPCHSHQFTVRCGEYPNGNLAVQVFEEDRDYVTTVSVNIEGVALAKGEFIFKTYSENEGFYEAMLEDGFIKPTGRTVLVGMAGLQPICRLK